jgi:pimeloyl-ACP methyl ester carboxylesterase
MIAPRSVSLAGSGGLRLAAEVWGDASRSPLLLLHGGGQTRGAWASAGEKLSALGWNVIAPDLRGHGESAWSAEGRYSVVDFADDVRALASQLDQPPVLVGASLGGLSSLLAAGEAPAIEVRALVLVDVAHRPLPAGVSRILDFMAGRPDGFASLEEAAAAIASYLPHRAAPAGLDGLQRNLRRRGGRWVWHWDPRLLDGIALPEAPRILRAARAISAPMLLVRGALSDVISEAIARELCTEVPGLATVDVAGAGHMVAGDRNDRFLDAITPFLVHLAPADAHALPGRGDATD